MVRLLPNLDGWAPDEEGGQFPFSDGSSDLELDELESLETG